MGIRKTGSISSLSSVCVTLRLYLTGTLPSYKSSSSLCHFWSRLTYGFLIGIASISNLWTLWYTEYTMIKSEQVWAASVGKGLGIWGEEVSYSRTDLHPCTFGNCIVQSKITRFESAMKALLLMLGIFHSFQIEMTSVSLYLKCVFKQQTLLGLPTFLWKVWHFYLSHKSPQ